MFLSHSNGFEEKMIFKLMSCISGGETQSQGWKGPGKTKQWINENTNIKFLLVNDCKENWWWLLTQYVVPMTINWWSQPNIHLGLG